MIPLLVPAAAVDDDDDAEPGCALLTTLIGALDAASRPASVAAALRSRSRCLRRWLRDIVGKAGKSS